MFYQVLSVSDNIFVTIIFTNSESLSKCEVNLHRLHLVIGVDARICILEEGIKNKSIGV